jgi:hypothetical protein
MDTDIQWPDPFDLLTEQIVDATSVPEMQALSEQLRKFADHAAARAVELQLKECTMQPVTTRVQ